MSYCIYIRMTPKSNDSRATNAKQMHHERYIPLALQELVSCDRSQGQNTILEGRREPQVATVYSSRTHNCTAAICAIGSLVSQFAAMG